MWSSSVGTYGRNLNNTRLEVEMESPSYFSKFVFYMYIFEAFLSRCNYHAQLSILFITEHFSETVIKLVDFYLHYIRCFQTLDQYGPIEEFVMCHSFL